MLLHVELAGRAQAQARVRSSAQSVKAAAAAGGMEGLARSHRSDSAPLSRVHERERTYIPVNQGLGAPLSPAEAKRRAGEALAAQRRLAPDVEGSKDPEESKPRRAPPLSTSDVRSRRTFEELKECDLEELQRRTRKESKEFPQAAVVKVDAAQASKPQLISVLLEHKLTGGKAKAEEVQQGAVSALQGTTVKLRAQRQAKSTIVVRNTTATQSELAVKMDALLDDSGLNVQDLELQGRDQAEPAETQGKPANMPLPPSLPNGSTPGSTGPRAKQMGPPKSPRHGKHVKQLTPAERARKLEQEKKAAQQKDDTQLVGTAKASARLLSRRRALSHIEMRTNWIAKAIFAAAGREGKELQINLPGCGVNDQAAVRLATTLAGTDISTLNLTFNQIGDIGTRAISKCLRHVPRLRELTLSSNLITDIGATALAQALADPSSGLVLLDLSGNMIGNDGAVLLAAMLEENASLVEVCLDSNYIGLGGKDALAEALANNKSGALEFVSLAGNVQSGLLRKYSDYGVVNRVKWTT